MSRARWGQNFLVNRGIVSAIVERAAPGSETLVVEVGPGRGVLTEALLARGSRVLALEIDPALIAVLEERFPAHPRLSLRHEDAARTDWPALLREAKESEVQLVANLPYEAGTPILLRWLEASQADPRLERAVVMLQLEVAERLAAGPGTKAYGSLGALAQLTHEVSRVVDVGPGSFRPPPKVRSRVVELRRRAEAPLASSDWSEAARFIHAAFGQRRKQMATALAGHGEVGRERWRALLEAAGHAPTARAEELAPAELIELARSAGLA